jgi:general secretion pathway protein G
MNVFMDAAARRRQLADQGRADRAPAPESGMTLIEIMVVVAIIGLLIGTVSVVAFQRFKKAQVTNTKQIISTVKNALQEYAMDSKEACPKDLKVLFEKKLINKDPKDAWGQELKMVCPGEHDKDSADITSKGPDKKEGTEDDINSWEI